MAPTAVLSAHRQERILRHLAATGAVSVGALSTDLDVSVDTVQRDLRRLEQHGALRRVRGGALPPSPHPAGFDERRSVAVGAKRRIAAAAAGLIEPGSVIGLAGGTTMLALSRELERLRPLTVLTSSLDVAQLLAGVDDVDVDLPGGRLHGPSRTLTGSDTVDALRRIRVDQALVSACSLDLAVGLSMQHREEAEVVRALLAGARSVVVLVTADRIGTSAAYSVAACDQIDRVVSDADATRLSAFADVGIAVTAA